MDAGGPIQMTYNNFPSSNGGLGLPGVGFASRGKGGGLKRLSLASPPKVGSISENPTDNLPTPPRTSRSHLLAGLRTAPRTPGAVPASAPYGKTHHFGPGTPKYPQTNHSAHGNVPQTAIGSNFPSQGQQYSVNPGQQYYTLPQQVLAPPPLEIDEQDEQMDPNMLAQLYATEVYLAQRQQALQQQLANITAQQQFAQMSINGHSNNRSHSSYPQTPVTPQLNSYNNQQAQNSNNNAIYTQEVAGQPGVYIVFNALTGQSTFAFDPNHQQQQHAELASSPPPPTPSHVSAGFKSDFRNDTSSPFDNGSPRYGSRSLSPPKNTSSPAQDVAPLPPPSANAFRRSHHRKQSSLVLNNVNNAPVGDGPRSAMIRPVGMPATPMTGTFGPGQSRAGEHPTRQPVGPPPFEELKAKPTTKHEGSKNFATRQRRRALNKLVRAGLERRITPRPGSGSAGSMTPVSDSELTFSIPPSDNDSDSGHSREGKLSSRPSIGSLRAVANGAIGSERKRSKESIGSSNGSDSEEALMPRPSALAVLSSAMEKRKIGGS
jgi:hypothetical protein